MGVGNMTILPHTVVCRLTKITCPVTRSGGDQAVLLRDRHWSRPKAGSARPLAKPRTGQGRPPARLRVGLASSVARLRSKPEGPEAASSGCCKRTPWPWVPWQ